MNEERDMKRIVGLLLGAALVLGLSLATAQAGEKVGDTSTSQLPDSLDSLYPPKMQQPAYLVEMLNLGRLFSGIPGELAEGDIGSAKNVFEEFQTDYVVMSRLISEWSGAFPMAPVTALGLALKGGDRRKVMQALDEVGSVCHDCHVKYMPLTQQKYHWGDFSTITVRDPLTKEEVPFSRLMKYIDANSSGISIDIERGEKGKARNQVRGFDARFQALKLTCERCHATKPKYYVDKEVQEMIDKLGQTLENPSADPKAAMNLVRRIGRESCFKCHLVHVPAAFGKPKEHSSR